MGFRPREVSGWGLSEWLGGNIWKYSARYGKLFCHESRRKVGAHYAMG